VDVALEAGFSILRMHISLEIGREYLLNNPLDFPMVGVFTVPILPMVGIFTVPLHISKFSFSPELQPKRAN
jgi:hypothetical protein